MKVTLVDNPKQLIRLLPFTYNKSIADLWLGTCSIRDIFTRELGGQVGVLTNEKLQALYPDRFSGLQLFVGSHIVPTAAFIRFLKELQEGQELRFDGNRIAYMGRSFSEKASEVIVVEECDLIKFPWDFIRWNAAFIKDSGQSLWQGDSSRALSVTGDVYIHEEADIQACFIDGSRGPVIIDEEAVVCNGANLVGPVYIGKGAVVLGNAYIRTGVTVADEATVGGEVKNSVFLPGATKSHEGVVGDSYIGAFANLGGGTTVSNLKNTYGTIKSIDHLSKELVDTGLQKLGCFIGDYVHTAILTRIQSGTSIGFGSQVFDDSEKLVEPCQWGVKDFTKGKLWKIIRRQSALKGISYSEVQLQFLEELLNSD